MPMQASARPRAPTPLRTTRGVKRLPRANCGGRSPSFGRKKANLCELLGFPHKNWISVLVEFLRQNFAPNQKIVIIMPRPPKAGKGKHVAQGRNFCTAQQQQAVAPLRGGTLAPFTRGPPAAESPVSPYCILTDEERLECWNRYINWVLSGKKVTDSPLPDLKSKFKACRRNNFFSDMPKRSVETGSIFRKGCSGRPVVYGAKVIGPIIKACVTSQRLKKKMASPSPICKKTVDKKTGQIPSEEWIRVRKLELGVVTVAVKRRPVLSAKPMSVRLATAKDATPPGGGDS